MNEEDVKILKDKVKYLLQMEEGKQYLLVFDKAAGLTPANISALNKILEADFNVKVISILIDSINSMRVLTLEETKK